MDVRVDQITGPGSGAHLARSRSPEREVPRSIRALTRTNHLRIWLVSSNQLDSQPGGGTAAPEPGPRITNACPRDVPEPPSITNDGHQQQPVNMKLARTLSRRATHRNTLVMRRSAGLGQGAIIIVRLRHFYVSRKSHSLPSTQRRVASFPLI
jgi:hypothetical protein